MKNKMNKRRYNLHYRVKKQGFYLYRKDKTIGIPVHKEPSKQVIYLQNEFKYLIQPQLF